jgi:hypothetical protein
MNCPACDLGGELGVEPPVDCCRAALSALG